jgi:dUTP pyrophosphatase
MIEYTKVRDVKSPNRGTPGSAGVDFFIPNYSEEFKKDFEEKNPELFLHNNIHEYPGHIFIPPKNSILIPSGIHVNIPKDSALIAFNKSGVAVKKGLDVGASVVDCDYEGEVHIHLTNNSDVTVKLECGEKVIQFLLVPIKFDDLFEKENLEELYKNNKSERGTGGFGSTGDK